MPQFVLASGSPRRIEFLRRLGYDFEVCVSGLDEESIHGETAQELASLLAKEKVYRVSRTRPANSLPIVGADTIVELDHSILGKPSSRKDAERMLRLLSGREHRVLTSLGVLVPSSREYRSTTVATSVVFRVLNQELLRWYLQSQDWYDAAGAYKIQSLGELLVKEIRGSFSNVVGLPVSEFYEIMSGLSVFPRKVNFRP